MKYKTPFGILVSDTCVFGCSDVYRSRADISPIFVTDGPTPWNVCDDYYRNRGLCKPNGKINPKLVCFFLQLCHHSLVQFSKLKRKSFVNKYDMRIRIVKIKSTACAGYFSYKSFSILF